jgi:hypothetical protein
MEDIILLTNKDRSMVINENVLSFFRKKISKKVKESYIINSPNFLADEATILFEDFFVKFDIKQGYLEIDNYFNPLPSPLGCLLSWLTFSFPKRNQKYPIITVSHMIEVAKRKEWFDPK